MENIITKKLEEIKTLIIDLTYSKNDTNNSWLDINQATRYCSCSVSTIRRNIDSGSLKVSTKLGKLLFKKSDLDNWLNK